MATRRPPLTLPLAQALALPLTLPLAPHPQQPESSTVELAAPPRGTHLSALRIQHPSTLDDGAAGRPPIRAPADRHSASEQRRSRRRRRSALRGYTTSLPVT